ncbi:MAG: hypothetical protein ACFFD2_23170 [Promethearchaeota archaeon]
MSVNNIEKKLINNNMLFFIPSWGDLLGYPTLGTYANQNVLKILSDPVIFLGGSECSFNTEEGYLHYLFGLGYYFLKFELKSGRYITDNRQLTGLILSDFVYDHLATSKNITLENDRDVIVAEKLFKVPIDLSFKSNNKITFIKGTLMRNLFIPYKDIFLEMMETIRNKDSYQLEKNGHMLLSTHRDSYNNIMISSEMAYGTKVKYLKPTAGLNNIMLGAEKHLNQNFTLEELKDINHRLLYLKQIYSELEYDPMYLFSILDNASKKLKSEYFIPFKDMDTGQIKMPKESIFLTAENRMNSFKEWPERFKRKTKEQLELSAIQSTLKLTNNIEKLIQPPNEDISELPKRGKDASFELRTMKKQIVEGKLLPKVPESSIKEILHFLKKIIEENYEMRAIGKAFEISRDNIRKIFLHWDNIWELSKLANIYQRKEEKLGLSYKEKNELLEKIDRWIAMTPKNLIKLGPKDI